MFNHLQCFHYWDQLNPFFFYHVVPTLINTTVKHLVKNHWEN